MALFKKYYPTSYLPKSSPNSIARRIIFKNGRMTASKLLSRLKKLEIDSKIDVRDSEYVWCIGKIKAVMQFSCSPKYIYVHYEGVDKVFDEYFSEGSDRIAPLGFYTNRNDIPRYILNSSGNSRLGLIVSSIDEMNRVNDRIANNGSSQYQRAMEAFFLNESLPLFTDISTDPVEIDLNSQYEE